jgi:hypothetical protein
VLVKVYTVERIGVYATEGDSVYKGYIGYIVYIPVCTTCPLQQTTVVSCGAAHALVQTQHP